MQYKINTHAHSFFSDGCNSPIEMARAAKDLGFCCLVLTDHYYGGQEPGLNLSLYRKLRLAAKEARQILPVIIGIELCALNQEILLFGGEAIKKFLALDCRPTEQEYSSIIHNTHCATILAHPHANFDKMIHLVDGYELSNSGADYREFTDFGCCENKQGWANSDAHSVECLHFAHNIIGSKVETEQDLIKYIKSGKQHDYYIIDKEPPS